MKAMEFRLGNLISDHFFMYRVGKIEHGIISGFSTADGRNVYPDTLYSLNEENLQGIPLTEEWLLKFGFKESNSDFYYINNFGVSRCFNAFSYKTCVWLQSIKYVHHLQNLYFALTDEELTIKE